jgi:hypothetical protein
VLNTGKRGRRGRRGDGVRTAPRWPDSARFSPTSPSIPRPPRRSPSAPRNQNPTGRDDNGLWSCCTRNFERGKKISAPEQGEHGGVGGEHGGVGGEQNVADESSHCRYNLPLISLKFIDASG